MTTRNYLDPLFVLQKRAIRMISSADRLVHTEPLFKKLSLMNLDNIYVLNVMLFMFKSQHGLLPSLFNEMFVVNNQIHDHFTRQASLYHLPAWRLEIRRRSMCIQGPVIWNKLCNNLDIDCTIITFKYHLKKFLLNNEVAF